MSVQRRDFLLLVVLATGTAMPARAQTVTPAAGLSGAEAIASTPRISLACGTAGYARALGRRHRAPVQSRTGRGSAASATTTSLWVITPIQF